MKVRLAKIADAVVISKIGQISYRDTYPSILSAEQINFMLNKSYTVEAIQELMSKGQDFYLLEQDGIVQGFIALQQMEPFILRIEKLYLLPKTKGRGFGKYLIDFAVEMANSKDLKIVELNVNRGNPAYYFYLKQGFVVSQTVDISYYDYILDDYVMQKNI